MPYRVIFFYMCLTLALAWYPGANPFYTFIAAHPALVNSTKTYAPLSLPLIPEIRTPVIPDTVSAQGVYIVEADSFTPLLSRNQHMHLFPASTTKIITALVAHDIFQPDRVINVQKTTEEGQLMGLVPGERITVENVLYGLLVHSGNDAAYALANAYGYDTFIARMNAKAQSLGMKDSTFTNPAGLDEQNQLTSPFDLAVAGRALLAQPYLKKIVGTKEIIISDVDYTHFHKLTNVNKLLGEIQGLGGLKTGYTEAAGENLVSFYRHDGHDFIIVVMKSEDRFADTVSLVEWIKANVQFVSPI